MKYDVRLKMVRHAQEHGIKPTARAFACQVKIVRKWYRRWLEDNFSRTSLSDRSRAPKTCPHKASPEQEKEVLRERDKAPCLGARRLKKFCKLTPSEGAIARILRQQGRTKKRKKKHEKKRDMREVKAKFKAMEQIQVDSKYLNDIPFYVDQMYRNPDLPRFQYTVRDVKTGALYLGFAQELSEANAACFVAAVLQHIKRCGYLENMDIVQTDNGSEYSGMERKTKKDRGFSHVVRDLFKLTHRFIPPGKKNHQADVETVHERIEAEFFDLERFQSREEFFRKASAWQLWWNTTRENGYKKNRTPDQILLEEEPERKPSIWFIPALDLDRLMNARADHALADEENKRGYYLPALPGTSKKMASRRGIKNSYTIPLPIQNAMCEESNIRIPSGKSPMKSILPFLLLATLAVSLFVAFKPEVTITYTLDPETKEDREEIDRLVSEYYEALRNGRFEDAAAMYSPEAREAAGGSLPILLRAAAGFGDGIPDDIRVDPIRVDGDTATGEIIIPDQTDALMRVVQEDAQGNRLGTWARTMNFTRHEGVWKIAGEGENLRGIEADKALELLRTLQNQPR